MADRDEYERARIAKLNGVDISQVATAAERREREDRARAADFAAIDAAVSSFTTRQAAISAADLQALTGQAQAEPVDYQDLTEQYGFQRNARGLYEHR